MIREDGFYWIKFRWRDMLPDEEPCLAIGLWSGYINEDGKDTGTWFLTQDEEIYDLDRVVWVSERLIPPAEASDV